MPLNVIPFKSYHEARLVGPAGFEPATNGL